MKLLIDSGNSRFKWAWLDKQGQLTTFAIANDHANRLQLLSAWSVFKQPEQILVASVASSALVLMVTDVLTGLWPMVQIQFIKTQAQAYGVLNAYEQADKLGVDRWLALVATHHYYPSFSCIVDCGTAVTLDVLNVEGVHQGGLISPGLILMKKALARNTAGLPYQKSSYPVGLATGTEAGIYNGTLYAILGLITQVLKQHEDIKQLILTGGDAELIAQQLDVPIIVDSDLVFKGLAVIANQTSA